MEAKRPDEFIAAAEWQDVQPSDQKELIDYYERQFNEPPDEEQAVDIYNRAMRVWLEVSPMARTEERDALRAALRTN